MPLSNEIAAEDNGEGQTIDVKATIVPNPAEQAEAADDQGDLFAGEGETAAEGLAREEAEAAEAAANGGGDGKVKTVPHQALHQERVARQAEAARAKALEAQLSTAISRMNALLSKQVMQPIDGDFDRTGLPDVEKDPIGYINALEDRLANSHARSQESQQTQQIDSGIEADEAAFSVIQPDYPDASEHYIQSRFNELSMFYSPQEVQQALYNEVRQIGRQAWQRGKSAAEVVYALAKARGYTPRQSEQGEQGGQPAPQPAGGATPALQQPQRQAPQAALEAVRRGQANSQSVGAAGGGGDAGQLNAQALLNMSDSEFEEYLGLGKKGANERFAAIAGR